MTSLLFMLSVSCGCCFYYYCRGYATLFSCFRKKDLGLEPPSQKPRERGPSGQSSSALRPLHPIPCTQLLKEASRHPRNHQHLRALAL